jgi:3-(3-hydroxy-phenyl)propionate hydroxylase
MTNKEMLYDVAIVGYGPVGGVLANLLGQAGISTLVLDREAGVYPLPRAVHFDGEVMRILEAIGLKSKVQAISRTGIKGMHFVNANQETLLIRAGSAELGPHGCANNYYFNQPDLDALLRDGASRFPNVDVLLQHEVTDVVTHDGHVQVIAGRMDQGVRRTISLQAKYVVGCDGARSMVRRTIGSTQKDLGLHQEWLVFDVILTQDVPALADHTVQLCDPARPMTYCCISATRRRWEIMLMPGDDPIEMVKPANLWSLVSRWGVSPNVADIERAVIYTFHSVVARGWRSGRLLIAGDAAHQMPPFLGQGMCSGLRDVANLAWKLKAVIQNNADDALLDSYEVERAPHVNAFIDLAVRLGDIIQTTDETKARERDKKFLSAKNGQPEVFVFPAPHLGQVTGVSVLHGEDELVGQIFPQPLLSTGQRLDALVQQRFAVLIRQTLLDEVGDASLLAWQQSNVAVIADAALLPWLDGQGLDAVVIRPDRYIYGVAKNAMELDALRATLWV